MGDIAANVNRVQERIQRACDRAGRDPASVRLIAVSKTVGLDRIREGVAAGIRMLGENYIQEAKDKIDASPDLDVTWHFIGHLQTNKAKFAAAYFTWVHTVDSLKLARELNKRAAGLDRRLNILLQVHLGEEATKEGVDPEQRPALYRDVSELEALQVRGLMVLPPYLADLEEVRPHFRQLRGLLLDLKAKSRDPDSLTELSMGMSHDFEAAVEEGATLVRVGTAIFGARR
jgi:pyridoxal phosphate enzyme (YggS family)